MLSLIFFLAQAPRTRSENWRETYMWLLSLKAREETTKAQEAAESDEWNDRSDRADGVGGGEASVGASNSVLPTPAAAVLAATSRKSNSSAGGSGGAVDSPDFLARMAAAAHLQELAGSKGAGVGTLRREVMDKRKETPDDYFYPYLFLACMWTSWGGNTPSEWKYLASSSGPQKRKKISDEVIVITEYNPVSMRQLRQRQKEKEGLLKIFYINE